MTALSGGGSGLRRCEASPFASEILSAGLLAAGGLAVLRTALPRLVREWSANPNCDHVKVVLPVALLFFALVVRRSMRERARNPARADWRAGLPLLAFSSACLYLDGALDEVFLLAVGLLTGLLGATAVLGGRAALKRALFPAVLLAFAVPLPQSAGARLFHVNLQRASAAACAGALSTFGLASEAHGSVVSVCGRALNVAEACSGLKFMTVAIFGGLCLGRFLTPRSTAARVLLAAAGAVLAFTANVARLVAAGLVTARAGSAEAAALLHGGKVYVVYALAAAALAATALVLRSVSRARLAVEEAVTT